MYPCRQQCPTRKIALLLLLIIFAVVSRVTIFARRNGNAGKFATLFCAVVVLANANVAHDGLLIFHTCHLLALSVDLFGKKYCQKTHFNRGKTHLFALQRTTQR